MRDLRLYYVDTTITHAVVADSPDGAVRIAQEHRLVVGDRAGLIKSGATAVLATEPRIYADALGMLPEWEYPPLDDVPADAEEWSDPDFTIPNAHVRRRWTVRRWIEEQSRFAPREATETQPAPVSVADDWRGPPTPEEVRAHHAAHARKGVSCWHVETTVGDVIVAMIGADEALRWRPHEGTRWRPCDWRMTPVAWPVIGGDQ